MYKFLALNIVVGCLFLLTSIATIAYEGKKIHEKTKPNFLFEGNFISSNLIINNCIYTHY